jgi:hypothetical protein
MNISLPFIGNLIDALRKRPKLVLRAKIRGGFMMAIGDSSIGGPNSLDIEVTFVKGEHPITIEFVGIHWEHAGDQELEVKKESVNNDKPVARIATHARVIPKDTVVYMWVRDVEGKKYFTDNWPSLDEWINDPRKKR